MFELYAAHNYLYGKKFIFPLNLNGINRRILAKKAPVIFEAIMIVALLKHFTKKTPETP